MDTTSNLCKPCRSWKQQHSALIIFIFPISLVMVKVVKYIFWFSSAVLFSNLCAACYLHSSHNIFKKSKYMYLVQVLQYSLYINKYRSIPYILAIYDLLLNRLLTVQALMQLYLNVLHSICMALNILP